MTTFFEQFRGRPVGLPASAAQLRTEPSAKFVSGMAMLVAGVNNSVVVPSGTSFAIFEWDAASLQADDGVWAIKPNDIPGPNPGRWIRSTTDANKRPSQTLYVDADTRSAVQDGSFGNPFFTIQQAIDAVPLAAVNVLDPWLILISPGFYNETPLVPAGKQVSLVAQGDIVGAGFSPAAVPAVVLGAAGPTNVINWNTAGTGAGITSLLMLVGISCLQVQTTNAPAPVSPPLLGIKRCVGGVAEVAPGTFTGSGFLTESSVTGYLASLATASLLTERCIISGPVSTGIWFDEASSTVGGIAATISGAGARFVDTDFAGVLTLTYPSGTVPRFSGHALRSAAKAGILPASFVLGSPTWDGDAGYYDWHHTVRAALVTANTQLDVADEYVACNPAAATTIDVTLPDANLLGTSAGNETIGGVARTPQRHITIRNVGTNANSVVQVLGSAGQRVDGGALTPGFVLLGGESITLVPVFLPSVGTWSWEPLTPRFGRNYQSANSAGVSTSASAVYVTKVTLTTPALRGVYRIVWRCIASASTAATDVQSRLNNATDAVQIGDICYSDVDSTAERVYHGGSGLVTFAGAAKTFNLEFQRPSGAGNAEVRDAWIEIWRVG